MAALRVVDACTALAVGEVPKIALMLNSFSRLAFAGSGFPQSLAQDETASSLSSSSATQTLPVCVHSTPDALEISSPSSGVSCSIRMPTMSSPPLLTYLRILWICARASVLTMATVLILLGAKASSLRLSRTSLPTSTGSIADAPLTADTGQDSSSGSKKHAIWVSPALASSDDMATHMAGCMPLNPPPALVCPLELGCSCEL